MRISELAKKLEVKSADVIAELEKLGVEGKKASSSIDESDIPKVEKALSKGAKKSAAKKTTKKTAKKAETKKTAKKTAKKGEQKEGEKKTAKKTAKKAVKNAEPAAKVEKKAEPKPEPKPAPKPDKKAEEAKAKADAEAKARAKAKAKAESDARLAAAIDAKAKAAATEAKARAEAKGKGKGKKGQPAQKSPVIDEQKRAEDKRKHDEFLRKKKEDAELKQLEKDIEAEEKREAEAGDRLVEVDETLTVKELAEIIKVPVNEIIKTLFLKGIPVTVNQILGLELAQEIALEQEYELVLKGAAVAEEEEVEDTSHLPLRPPVITVMGHVDHGKTSLLDAIRKTDVAGGEAGGITQHIGAYSINTAHGDFTFLDTPGHEAFTALRARGAEITDVVVLVVAADDGVMPQTVEALNHAKAAGVEMIVAVNKVDKPDADPDRVKQELTKYGLLPEDWGGTNIFVNVSAKSGQGIDDLLEMIHLQSEILELRADPNAMAHAIVVESRLDKNRGPLHSIIVTKGTLKVGDPFIMGNTYGKVRAMLNDKGERVKTAGPSMPVELLGCNEMCDPGDVMNVVESDKKARQISETKKDSHRARKLAKQHVRLENVVERLHEGETADLNLIIKADTQGSVDAVRELLGKLEFKEVQLKVIHDGVGGITETDVTLADASDAIVIGFNVRPTEKATRLADENGIDLRLYTIIYEITDEVKNAVKGILKPKFEEVVIGRAEVRDLFKVSKIGTIAGCMVQDGLVRRNATARLIRDNVIIYSGVLSSVRRFKDDVKEVQQGYECGLTLEKFNDIKVGDVVEVFEQKEVTREL